MKHAGVFPRGDDRLVGHFATLPSELTDQFGLQFVFHHARPKRREHATESTVGDLDRPPHKLHLGGVLHRPQLPQERLETFVAVERISRQERAGLSQVAGFDLGARPLVFVGVEVDPLALAHERVQHARQVGQPADLCHARNLPRLVLGELVALPGGEQFIRLADEEHLPLGGVDRVGRKHEHALLLLDPREPEEVAGRMEPERAVARGGQQIGGVHDDEALRRQKRRQVLTVGEEQGWLDRGVTHGQHSSAGKLDRTLLATPSHRSRGPPPCLPTPLSVMPNRC